MLPQFSAIPLQSTEASSDSARNLNQVLPVGKNVSATVVAISRDQIQPEIFRLKLEINNRLIQMGVFQALPVGQKINVNRQSDGQIQITPQPSQGSGTPSAVNEKSGAPVQTPQTQSQGNTQRSAQDVNIQLQPTSTAANSKLPDNGRLLAAVISSRPVFPNTASGSQTGSQPISQPTQNPVPNTALNAQTTPQTPSQSQGGTNATASPSQTQSQATPPAPTIQTQTSSQNSENRKATNNAPNVATITAKTPNTSQNTVNSSNTPVTNQTQTTDGRGAIPPQNISPTPVKSNSAPVANPSQLASGTAQQTTAVPSQQQSISAPSQKSDSSTIPSNSATPTVAPQKTVSAGTQAPHSTAASKIETTPVTTNPITPASNEQKKPPVNTQSANPGVVNTARINPPPSHHAITLALPDGSKVEFNSPQPLPQGAQLLLQKNAGQAPVIVKIQLPALNPNSALDKPAIQEVLRNALPIQIPTGDVFSQLAQTAAVTEGSQAAQISSVVRSMLQLFGVRPGSQEAPSQIRQNIELGGLHTERFLSEGKAPNPQDMKSQLQQLQNLADRLPDEQRERFEQLLRGLHSRVTSQQLNSLQQWRELPDGGFERVLQFDLPIKQGDRWDNLELRLSREGGSNAAGELISVWRVRLHFDLDELGGVDAEIRLSDEHEISTLFWCDKEGTAEKLRAKADNFAERLRECGFSNSEVQWHQGEAPEQKQAIHKKLVDLHT